MITGKNYIGNQLSALGNKTYKTFNPELNQENKHVFSEATQEEINEAVNLASKAFKKYRTISGERKTKKEVKEKDYYKKESSYGKFQRSFTLPDNTDPENIEANSKDGVLEVVIPKMERSKKETKKIKIK